MVSYIGNSLEARRRIGYIMMAKWVDSRILYVDGFKRKERKGSLGSVSFLQCCEIRLPYWLQPHLSCICGKGRKQYLLDTPNYSLNLFILLFNKN
jgi:hypothetical protein